MGRSLGLAAYRALSRRSGSRRFTPAAQRLTDELVWIHAAGGNALLAVHDLASSLCAARDGMQVLITLPDPDTLEQMQGIAPASDNIILDEVPSEYPEAIATFLRHYAPDTGIWVWGGLRPNLITAMQETGAPMVLIDADTGGFDGRRERWLPDLTGSLLADFTAVLARSDAAVKRLVALGVSKRRIRLTPPMQAGGQALPCEDSDLADLSGLLGGRPVWLAVSAQESEVMTILSAHRRALRLSHRLLLILHPAEDVGTDDLTARIANEGLRLRNWSAGEEPDDATQVLLTWDARDLGLFYRVAPVSFMGGSLNAGHPGRNPFEAAALGSAVLYGPNVRKYLPFYTRLATAGAARIVNDADSLGTAVTKLIAPDQAATMAHAGWDVTSQGAALTDEVTELVRKALDDREEQRHARP
ncbi:3-deoxy-D-manno-octulosonic acid transferase [Roseobacter ponti]|uniref:3-deoxy-D-manno-octulosonic acid transferase n=1 Tax=Roseobacter ponti TaxID=1891787 RepID=A0A858SLZ9_9RHOB|nr:glycosyltransferase N-terminal domain-containing protein [Roseobacter ponti]QJF49874.1 3-deoxy-D-manno-octulosonic acid transferase [Roseobacter ponti]